MDLNSTRMFVNVVTKGSFSAAASFMAAPVATASRRVAALESALGVRLFERSTRKLRLTEAGAILYKFSSRELEAHLHLTHDNNHQPYEVFPFWVFRSICWLLNS